MATGHDETAPGDLETVRTFVNTYDLFDHDDVATPSALAAWLIERGLLPAGTTLSEDDVARAQTVREAIRDLTEANGGCEPSRAELALPVVREAATRAPLCLTFRDASAAGLEPLDKGIDGALGRLLAIVHRAMDSGDWQRLKPCKDPTCRWLYYDHSKNRSAAWCDMASCGNRAKARRRRMNRASAS